MRRIASIIGLALVLEFVGASWAFSAQTLMVGPTLTSVSYATNNICCGQVLWSADVPSGQTYTLEDFSTNFHDGSTPWLMSLHVNYTPSGQPAGSVLWVFAEWDRTDSGPIGQVPLSWQNRPTYPHVPLIGPGHIDVVIFNQSDHSTVGFSWGLVWTISP